MRPTPNTSFLIEEGHHEWDVESHLAWLHAEIIEAGGNMFWASATGFDDHGLYRFELEELLREKRKFEQRLPRFKDMHDDIARHLDESDGLGWNADEKLAADLEAKLWPDVGLSL